MAEINNIVLAATFACNLRCKYCDIWKRKDIDTLDIEYYKKIPHTKSINISGGEPFLRPDIVDLVIVLDKIADRLVFSTNGFATELIVQRLNEMLEKGVSKRKLAVRVSLDGPKEMHDRLRGVPGSYDHAIATVKRVKEIIPDVGIAFTVSPDNYMYLMDMYNLAKELGVDFTTAVVHSSDIYFGEGKGNVNSQAALNIAKAFEELKKRQLSSPKPKSWGRAFFTQGEIEFTLHKHRLLPCDAGIKSFFIDPHGNVYPCNILPSKLGNLETDNWEDIAKKGKEFYEKIGKACNKCWMVCTAVSPMHAHLLDVGLWILRNKLKI